MVIRVIDNREEATKIAGAIREATQICGDGRDDLWRIARKIEASGDMTLADIFDLQSVLAESKTFAECIETILKGVGQ